MLRTYYIVLLSVVYIVSNGDAFYFDYITNFTTRTNYINYIIMFTKIFKIKTVGSIN